LLKIPKRHAPFIFGAIQSGLTSGVAAAIAHSSDSLDLFPSHWARSWILSWITVLPIVLLAAPVIRKVVNCMTDSGTV
jgi:Protein of unknown function (DUF2798)